jgi:hypothetical protein
VTTSAVCSIVITMAAFLTASSGEEATWAPASRSGFVTDGERSHTVVRALAAIRRRAMAESMMPVPAPLPVGSPHGHL